MVGKWTLTESEEERIVEIYKSHAKHWREWKSKLNLRKNEEERILTESEERRIEEIYENRVKQWREWKSKFNLHYKELKRSRVEWCIKSMISLFNLHYKELKRAGLSNGEIVDFHFPNDFHKSIWEDEAEFTKRHLKYLAMKSRIDESEFRNYLQDTSLHLQLRESDKDELVEIFRKVKERAENMGVSDECKLELTPWEFFKIFFYQRGILALTLRLRGWVNMEDKVKSTPWDKCFVKGKVDTEDLVRMLWDLYKVLNIFQKFDEAPRISGDLVVELEDVLEENKDIIPVSRDKVMKLVETWRRYKMEERLV